MKTTTKQEILEDFCLFGENLARIVFAPDYYQGQWWISLNGKVKVCSNYTTAKAWIGYLSRNGHICIGHGKFYSMKEAFICAR